MTIHISGKGKLANPVNYFNEVFRRAGYMAASKEMYRLGYKVVIKDPNVK